MPTITGGKYIRYNNKRFFTMSTAIAIDGSTNVPAEAVQGSIGVTTHATGKSYWFVSNGTKWIANGGAVSSTAFADITGAAGDNASLATALAAKATILTSYLANNITYNNTAALANTTLSVTVEAATKYEIELKVYTDNAAKAVNVDFGGTATLTAFIGDWFSVEATNPITDVSGLRVTAAGTDFTNVAFDGIQGVTYTFKGSMTTNGAGTFLLRGAQNAADPSNTVILAGSVLKLTKIP